MRDCAAKLDAGYHVEGLVAAWNEALEAPAWHGPATWCHCDLDLRNTVFLDGRPGGVLDWGWAGAGDPASDAAAGWKVLPAGAREAFWDALGADAAEIARARGWTLLQCAGALSYYTPEQPGPPPRGRALAQRDSRFRSQTILSPSSVRKGSTWPIVRECGAIRSTRPPVPITGASAPSSPRMASTMPSTWPAKP